MLILLTAGCFVYAETAIWINGSGDRDWSAAINWVPGVPQSSIPRLKDPLSTTGPKRQMSLQSVTPEPAWPRCLSMQAQP
ncbi:MAG: hypothetical protein ACYSUH_10370 [Planctomycetota bacterium]|jgi:hypothetical protein